MTLRIGLTGDVMLGRLVDERQRRRPVEAVWGDLLDRLRSSDALFVNLECCLSTRGEPWRRTHRPFHFRADPGWAIPALERAGVDACALANNHVLDFETVGLCDTLDELDDAGIAHAGAGRTLDEALEPAFVTVGDRTIAFVSFTDNTPEYAAAETSPGTAFIEIDVNDAETRSSVSEALCRARRGDPDLVVASLHWGPNMVERPPDSFRRFARWLLDEGVDVVHGHSAHVFHGIEIHDGKPCLYDTGDFVDDYAVDARLRNDRSFLFELTVTVDGRVSELRLLPTEIDDYAVHEATLEAAEWSRARMRELSSEFATAFERDGEELVLTLDG
ncbi:CapA family protein [Halalkalicoccus sp. NIPERK01]|uniref:CapA family protein n=1 Tax=Halalkalicoccus sp. NIPERK01 TaxID=3053469 RepID=UPI00256F286F|nr:CapA family protein [Halalkalicoccus sp. NIPERK01]MDL5360830.1 CapA family protein [Halalkalicoccus sp. NIPERK01]